MQTQKIYSQEFDLADWMPPHESTIIHAALRGEEKQFFADKIREYADRIKSMPKTGEQDNTPDPIAHLHYFFRGSHWYITEKDKEGTGREQAFGFACLAGMPDCAEYGYISIDELTALGAELDLYFAPARMSVIKTKLGV